MQFIKIGWPEEGKRHWPSFKFNGNTSQCVEPTLTRFYPMTVVERGVTKFDWERSWTYDGDVEAGKIAGEHGAAFGDGLIGAHVGNVLEKVVGIGHRFQTRQTRGPCSAARQPQHGRHHRCHEILPIFKRFTSVLSKVYFLFCSEWITNSSQDH